MQFWSQMTNLLSRQDPYETRAMRMRQARDMNPRHARTNAQIFEMKAVGMYLASENDA